MVFSWQRSQVGLCTAGAPWGLHLLRSMPGTTELGRYLVCSSPTIAWIWVTLHWLRPCPVAWFLVVYFFVHFISYYIYWGGRRFAEAWRPTGMTSTPPKNQTAYLDVELPVTDDQLSAAGNLSSALPAPFHLSLFQKEKAFSLRCLLRYTTWLCVCVLWCYVPSEVRSVVSPFLSVWSCR